MDDGCPAEGYNYAADLIPQPDKLCGWAACAAMLMSYRWSASYSPDDVARESGLQLDQSVGWESVNVLLDHFGFSYVQLPPAGALSPSRGDWCAWLGIYGPLWVTNTESPNRGIVVMGIQVDPSGAGGTLQVCDPWDINQTFSDDPVEFDPPNHGATYYCDWENLPTMLSEIGLESGDALNILCLSASEGDAPASMPDTTGEEEPVPVTDALRIVYPSGAAFTHVGEPVDGNDYSDPVTGGSVPLIDTFGREDEYLSANFQVREFMGSNHARYARISPDLVSGLESLRDLVARPITINSGYRYLALNDEKGGADLSRHVSGQAADIACDDITPLELAGFALEAIGCTIGIGLGKHYIHVDVRETRATWVYDGAAMSAAQFKVWIQQQCD